MWLTCLQQEVQLEHTRRQHMVRHEAPVPERSLSPVQVSWQMDTAQALQVLRHASCLHIKLELLLMHPACI